jgi:high-affinity iron transporter
MNKKLFDVTVFLATGLIAGVILNFAGSALSQSFLIMVREGFEAILLVTALAAYLRRVGENDKVWVVYHGAVWALAASALTAYLLATMLDSYGGSREAFEGVSMLIAAVVLFYLSCWLFAKRELDRWRKYVHKQISKAISSGKLFTLGFAAFLAVYREGAETILFYHAMLAGTEGQTVSIVIGFVAAVVCLGGVYWVMRSAAFRLPIGIFFTVTAAFLYYLTFFFAGKGIHELQEALWVPETIIEWMPRIDWLGVYPTVETVTAQSFLIVPLLATAAWRLYKHLGRDTDKPISAPSG